MDRGRERAKAFVGGTAGLDCEKDEGVGTYVNGEKVWNDTWEVGGFGGFCSGRTQRIACSSVCRRKVVSSGVVLGCFPAAQRAQM